MCLYQRVVSKIKTTFALGRRANTVKHDRRSCASHGQHYSQRSNFVSGSGRYNWEQAGARAIVLWPYFIEFSFSIILMAYGFFFPRNCVDYVKQFRDIGTDPWINSCIVSIDESVGRGKSMETLEEIDTSGVRDWFMNKVEFYFLCGKRSKV